MLRRHLSSSVLRATPVAALCTGQAFCASKPALTIYKSRRPSVKAEYEKYNSLCDFMFHKWSTAPDGKIACIQQETGQKYNYKELMGLTQKFANIFYHHANVRKGTVVCIKLLDHILYPPIAYGLMSLGAVVTTTNAVATAETLAYHVEKSQSDVIIGMKVFHHVIEDTVKMVKEATGKELRVLYMDDLMGMEAPAIPSSYTAMQEAKTDDTIFVPFSSGTMGNAKGVQLTNRNLVANMVQAHAMFSIYENDIFATVLPFFHIFGFSTIMSTALAYQSTQVIMMKYSVDTYAKTLRDYKCTAGFIAPPIAGSLVQALQAGKIQKEDFETVKVLLSSSAPLSPTVGKVFSQLLPNVFLCQGWGMTEMSPAVCVFPRGNTELNYEIAGCLVPDTELRIVKVDEDQQSGADKSAGVDCAAGEDGEIWLRGPQMMKGYLDPKDNETAFQDGWYRTGDIGNYDVNTEALMVTSRLKELIKYKGFQVSPTALESEILKHPWVAECVVVGVPDPRDVSFEMPRALVVLKPTVTMSEALNASDDIYRFIMTTCPPHKRLHGGVRIVEAIPKNATGKVLRRQARQSEIESMKEHIAEKKSDETTGGAAAAV